MPAGVTVRVQGSVFPCWSEGHIPGEIKTHAENKAKVVPNENKTHSEADEVCRIVPGKGNSRTDSESADGGLTLDSGMTKKIVPPSAKPDEKIYS